MPNHVYHHFAMSNLSDKQKEILKKIESNHHGLCGYYIPMPNEMTQTQSPINVVSESEYERIMEENKKIDRTKPFFYEPKPITKAMQDRLIQLYGHDNWYDWANDRWGTKWGCYDSDIDGETLRCTTAWSPMRIEIVELFALDFPDFTWHWEEEQGYGQTMIFENGKFVDGDSYDPPEFITVGEFKEKIGDDTWTTQIVYTYGRPETLSTDLIPPGFYKDYCFDEDSHLGDVVPMDIFRQLTVEQQEKVITLYHQ